MNNAACMRKTMVQWFAKKWPAAWWEEAGSPENP